MVNIIELAREANSKGDINASWLKRFATLVRAQALEEAAEVCDRRGDGWLKARFAKTIDEGCMHAAAKAEANALAAAIRALIKENRHENSHS